MAGLMGADAAIDAHAADGLEDRLGIAPGDLAQFADAQRLVAVDEQGAEYAVDQADILADEVSALGRFADGQAQVIQLEDLAGFGMYIIEDLAQVAGPARLRAALASDA